MQSTAMNLPLCLLGVIRGLVPFMRLTQELEQCNEDLPETVQSTTPLALTSTARFGMGVVAREIPRPT